MTGHDVLGALAAICMLLGAVLAVSGTLGIVRFPDVLSRLHAATKPQVLGLRLMRSGCVFLRGAQSAPWS